jgi:hypothetical protein
MVLGDSWRQQENHMSEQTTVPRLHLPDVAEFRRHFEIPRRPVVITGAMDNWKAMRHWSPGYFAEHLGDELLSAVATEEDPPEDGPIGPAELMRLRRVKLTMREYMEEVASSRPLRSYVSGMPLQRNLPMLLDDIDKSQYCEVGSAVSPRMWLGRLIGPR